MSRVIRREDHDRSTHSCRGVAAAAGLRGRAGRGGLRIKDAVVYAIWGAGPRQRLGLVTGNTTQTLTTPLRAGGDLRIEVDFIAGDDVVSQSMGVFRGDHIHVTIPPGAE
jgi:hypothetical protein